MTFTPTPINLPSARTRRIATEAQAVEPAGTGCCPAYGHVYEWEDLTTCADCGAKVPYAAFMS